METGKSTRKLFAQSVFCRISRRKPMNELIKVVQLPVIEEQLRSMKEAVDKRVEELKTYGEDVIGIVGNVLDKL
jgi:hypothetical protein